MRGFFLVFLILSIFYSCDFQNLNSNTQSIEEFLMDKEWILVSSDEPTKRFQSGIKFSSDKQLFNIDSQGHIIPPQHEQIYSITKDTLVIVDYKYEPQFIYEKGTDILLVEKISENQIQLKILHPNGPNTLIFENLE